MILEDSHFSSHVTNQSMEHIEIVFTNKAYLYAGQICYMMLEQILIATYYELECQYQRYHHFVVKAYYNIGRVPA